MITLPKPQEEMNKAYQEIIVDLLASTMVVVRDLVQPIATKNTENISKYGNALWKVGQISQATVKVIDLINSLDQQVNIQKAGEKHE